METHLTEGSGRGKLLSPSRRRRCIERVRSVFRIAERRACRVLGQPRSTQRRLVKPPGDEGALTRDIVALASKYGRYGYRRVTAMLHTEGWVVNHKRVERIWRREGLKVPKRQPKRGRLWLSDGSVRTQGTRPNLPWIQRVRTRSLSSSGWRFESRFR